MGRLVRNLIDFARCHIGVRILAGFGLITLLALLVALVSLTNVVAVNHRLDEAGRRDLQIAANVLRLQLAVERQSDGVRGFLLSGDDRYLASFDAGGALFDRTIGELEQTVPYADSADRLAEIRRLEERFRDVARQQIVLHRQGWQVSAIYLWSITGRESQDALIAAIDDYSTWQEEAMTAQLLVAREQSQLAIMIGLGLVGLAAVVSAIIGLLLTRSITRPIRALASVAARMKDGDLDVAVPTGSQDEIGTLAQTMEQMAASLKESRRSLEASLAETEQRNRELLSLNTVAGAAATLDRDQLLTTTLDTVIELTSARAGIIHLRDATGVLQPVAQRSLPDSLLKPAILAMIAQLLEEKIVATGQVDMITEESVEPADLLAALQAADIYSAVAIPLTSQGRLLGVLSLGVGPGRHFDEREVATLTSIGNQIGVALENASLLIHREQRITTLSVINEISRAISGELDLDQLYALIYDQCRRTLDIANFTLLLHDEETGQAIPSLIYWNGEWRDPNQGLPFTPSLLNVVARERRPLLTNDYVATCRQYGLPLVNDVREDERRSWLGVPMTIGERLIGTIAISTTTATYSEEDRDLLAAVANQAAVAIENAHLYRQTRELGVIEERNRLAREIHDTIAQGLTGIVLQLEAASTLLQSKPERALQRLTKATELARSSLSEARRSVWNLRPAPLEEKSLFEAIEAQTHRLEDEGIVVTCRTEGEPGRLAPEIENGVYRIAQEALQNVRKHARATRVDVALVWSEDQLRLVIHDNGQGFDPAQLSRQRNDGGGFGLLGMRERARLVGGTLDIQSEPGVGTVLEIQVPLSAHAGIPKPTQPATPTSTRALIP